MVCQTYSPPDGFVPTMANPLLNCDYDAYTNQPEGPNRCIVPFIACGDLSGFDSDKTYPLQVGLHHVYFLDTGFTQNWIGRNLSRQKNSS